jgi:hypothetical protein
MGSSRKGGLWEVGRYVYPYPYRRKSLVVDNIVGRFKVELIDRAARIIQVILCLGRLRRHHSDLDFLGSDRLPGDGIACKIEDERKASSMRHVRNDSR